MDKAEHELFPGSDDMGPLLTARMAEDMLPFTHQIVFCCNQPNQFIAWMKDEDVLGADPDPSGFDFPQLKSHISETLAKLDEAKTCLNPENLDRDKLIKLPPNNGLTLSGPAYVNDWLMPNFYFHYVTAYNILRSRGLEIGKANYMAHLIHLVRPLDI
tara:strand:+ start:20095 stop:20568 length:474 start_codon:yes stop_codon:yes gene_type:complete